MIVPHGIILLFPPPFLLLLSRLLPHLLTPHPHHRISRSYIGKWQMSSPVRHMRMHVPDALVRFVQSDSVRMTARDRMAVTRVRVRDKMAE